VVIPRTNTIVVRPRVDADVDELVRIAARVQQSDGYPGRRPRDLRSFLYSADSLLAWVAQDGSAIAGHVAIHRESLPVVMARAADALHCDAGELAVVARLIVDPDRRRTGIGRALLKTAAAAARLQGLHPILDVATHYDAAIALYRSCGWRNVGKVTMVFADGFELQSYVYVAPEA
jgi:ribosomal protein S18 acetylase RimI-like enzyme